MVNNGFRIMLGARTLLALRDVLLVDFESDKLTLPEVELLNFLARLPFGTKTLIEPVTIAESQVPTIRERVLSL